MTRELLPRRAPPGSHRELIECPLCGSQTRYYPRHYNQCHGQSARYPHHVRQRLPWGWATKHGFLYCACGDLVDPSGDREASFRRHWHGPRRVYRQGGLVRVTSCPKPGLYGDDREPWTLPPGRYPVYEGSRPREIPHPGLSRLPVPVRPMGVARREGAQGVPEVPEVPEAQPEGDVAQPEVPEAQQEVPEAHQEANQAQGQPQQEGEVAHQEGEVAQQEANQAQGQAHQVAPVTHQEAPVTHQQTQQAHQEAQLAQQGQPAHQEANQVLGQAHQEAQLAHQEGEVPHQEATQDQGQAHQDEGQAPPSHGVFSGDSSLSDPPSDLSLSEGSEAPPTDRHATPDERACFPRGVPPALAERVRTVGALAAHRELATEHIEEVLIELQHHGLDTDEGLLALYLQVVASRTVYTALPGKWQRSMRKALDGLCAYQVQHGSPLVELMILLLPKLGVFPGLAQSQTDDERDAELARLEAYPGPQWKALIQQTVEKGVGAILADFLEGWGGSTEGEAHAQEAAQQRVGNLGDLGDSDDLPATHLDRVDTSDPTERVLQGLEGDLSSARQPRASSPLLAALDLSRPTSQSQRELATESRLAALDLWSPGHSTPRAPMDLSLIVDISEDMEGGAQEASLASSGSPPLASSGSPPLASPGSPPRSPGWASRGSPPRSPRSSPRSPGWASPRGTPETTSASSRYTTPESSPGTPGPGLPWMPAGLSTQRIIPYAKSHIITRMGREGRIREATRILEGLIHHERGQVAPASAHTEAELIQLHPRGEPTPFARTARHAGYRRVSIPVAQIIDTVKHMSCDSAAGPSGWTVLHWRDMLTMRQLGPDAIHDYVQQKVREITQDTGPDNRFLCGARITPLLKANGKIRPIAVGEVLYRLLMRTIVQALKNDIQASLGPGQFGVGQAGGVEPIVRLVEHAIHRPELGYTHLTKLDFSNAYNRMGRRTMAEACRKHCSILYRAARWAYKQATPLVAMARRRSVDERDGMPALLLTSSEGVRQGDPLAPVLFSLGMRGFLEALQDRLGPDHLVMAYLDDVVILSKSGAETVQVAAAVAAQEAPGLCLNIDKSSCTPLEAIRQTGTDLLGTALGSAGYREAFGMAKVERIERILPALVELPKQLAWLILSRCLVGRNAHLLRQLETADLCANGVNPIWWRQDRGFAWIVQHLRGSSISLITDPILFALPLRLGGLGLRGYSFVAPLARQAMSSMADHELVRRGLMEPEYVGLGVFAALGSEEQRDAMSQIPRQGAMTDDMYKHMAEWMLLGAPDGVGRAMLEQSVPLGRRWLQVLPRYGRLSLQDYDMSVGLQLRTMCPPHADGCKACAVIGARLSHSEHCEDRWYRGQLLRHDGVRDVLFDYVRRNEHVEVEREAPVMAGRQERSDLLVRGLHAGPGPETHYDLFIREVTGSGEERNGREEVSLRPTGQPNEYMWDWQAPEKRAQQEQQVRAAVSASSVASAASARKAMLWRQISRTLGERHREKERKYAFCPNMRPIGLSASGVQTKGFRDALHAFGRGLTEMDRMQVRERLSVELLRWRARLYGH